MTKAGQMRPQRVTRSRRSILAIVLLLTTCLVPFSVRAESGTWAPWTKQADPVFEGQFIASDPAIIRDGDQYRMFYTCFSLDPTKAFDPATTHAAICEATSNDGTAWTPIPVDGPIEGLVLEGQQGTWNENLEGSFALKQDGKYLLYYSGYRQQGTPAMGYPAALAIASSSDGVTFTRLQEGPILRPTPGWYDSNAIYSPTIINYDNQLVMIYAGHCYVDCTVDWGVTLLAATSTDGVTWTKRDEPVLTKQPALDWTRDGVAEPSLVEGPDGQFYLFFTALKDDDRVIGIARSSSPLGPWEINPEPILVPTTTETSFDRAGVLAPDVHIEGNRVRMWFLGATPDEDIAIGYAEATWPLSRT